MSSIHTSAPFYIHGDGLKFECTARGHREGRKIVVDDLTIIGTSARPFGEFVPVDLDALQAIRCERNILDRFGDKVEAELRAEEVASMTKAWNGVQI